MSIEQDIKTIISLLEVLAGQKAAGKVQQVFSEPAESNSSMPEGTTDFAKIRETLPTLSKEQRNQWYTLCTDKSKSDKQKAAIAKIFKESMSA